jgi:DNA repair exonuclease SbcCD nuclease subunit
MRVLFLSDTHLGHDLARRRAARERCGGDFFESFDAPRPEGQLRLL